jgi:flagellar FliL protein
MAAEASSAEGEVKPAAGGAGKRRLVIIIAAAVAVLVIGGASYFFLIAGKHDSAAAGTTAAAQPARPDTFIFSLPPITVNLNSDGPTQNFLKLSVALEVPDQKMMTEIQPQMAKVLDAFQVYLRELRKSDLDGSAGIYRLKEELRRRINIAIAPAHIDSVLFKEILVQ